MLDLINPDTFWPKVNKRHPDECWEWLGAVGSRADSGYGYYGLTDGRSVGAHRASFALSGRTVQPGQQIDHLCRNRRCVNPAHLEAVSHRENALRGESPVAVNAKKTHCIRGHELSQENTLTRINGWRGCKVCKRDKKRERYAARAALKEHE
jgi:hypothetical protein